MAMPWLTWTANLTNQKSSRSAKIFAHI
jgi:hypothetical protein